MSRQAGKSSRRVEASFGINIHAVRRAIRAARNPVAVITWGGGDKETRAVVVLFDQRLVVCVQGRVFEADVRWIDARLGGISPSCICGSCARGCYNLYVNNDLLQCRYCADLGYESQHRDRAGRALLKTEKIAARLGRDASGAALARPIGMWRRTYLRTIKHLAQARREYFDSVRRRQDLPEGT